MKEYLTLIVTPLLNDPDSLSVTGSMDQMGVLLTLKVSRLDMGAIIGKQGETAKAIRALMRVFGGRNQARVAVKIVEPDGSTFTREPRVFKSIDEEIAAL